MDYRIEKKKPFTLVSRKELFSSDMDESKKEIPLFWNKCREDGSLEKLCKYMDKESPFKDAIVGACFENMAGEEKFPYAIGVAYNGLPLEDKFQIDNIPSQTWAVFPCVGAMPFALQKLLHRIYTEFFPSIEYKPAGGYDIEVYPEGDISLPSYKSEIWISVEKK